MSAKVKQSDKKMYYGPTDDEVKQIEKEYKSVFEKIRKAGLD